MVRFYVFAYVRDFFSAFAHRSLDSDIEIAVDNEIKNWENKKRNKI